MPGFLSVVFVLNAGITPACQRTILMLYAENVNQTHRVLDVALVETKLEKSLPMVRFVKIAFITFLNLNFVGHVVVLLPT